MCDTFYIPAAYTKNGKALFGKNSDREPNEAQEVVLYPACDFPEGALLRCTYREIPQVAHTYRVLLSRPFWMWGAEMGVNEHGVVIGNEAVFTKVAQEKAPALTGMDLLRLGLERAATAEEALHIIIDLLQTYGQGGNCGMDHALVYHNSFLIADCNGAWVLETAGREWAAEKVTDVRSISNAITIGKQWDLVSPGLVKNALALGWCRSEAEFDFARCYSDFVYTRFSAAAHRQTCSTGLMQARRGEAVLADALNILRSHGAGGPGWRPDRALAGAEVCMHAGFGPIRGSQTAGSMAVELGPDLATIWVTGTAAPCTSLFKPVWIDTELPWNEPEPVGKFSDKNLWWRHERLHRAVLQDFAGRGPTYHAERDSLEAAFRTDVQQAGNDAQARAQASAACFRRAETAEADWLGRVLALERGVSNAVYYDYVWRQFNRKARL